MTRRYVVPVTLLLVAVLLVGSVVSRAAERDPAQALAGLDGTRSTYLIVYRHGANWVDGKPMGEQAGMREHFAYYVDLHRKGLLVAGGGFTDASGGAAVIEAADDAAAEAILAADPAVRGGVFRYELRRWKPNPWEQISRQRAERGL